MGKKLIIAAALMIMAASIIMLNCAPDTLPGVPLDNNPPSLSFTNLPLEDSTFTSSAFVKWYGRDDDGLVEEYYFIVAIEADVQSDEVGYIANVLDTLSMTEWVMTESTSALIQLFAISDEEDSLQQYIFVKCKDDDGDFSNTISMNLYRQNHIPQTYLDLLPGNLDDTYYIDSLGGEWVITDLVWSLADTNALWEGFEITWNGDDTLDFPDDQPDFQYIWKMYGPYDISAFDDTLNFVNLSLSDTTVDSLYAFSCSESDSGYYDASQWPNDSVWVWNQLADFVGVPSGCYIFTVMVRDDSEVEDTTVAWGTFACVMPKWVEAPDSVKDIIVIQATQYTYSPVRTYVHYYNSDSTAVYPDSVQDFYSEMIENAGFTSDDYLIYGSPATSPLNIDNLPDPIELAYYRMIILDDMDWHSRELGDEYTNVFIEPLKNYLAAGGKAWVIGRQSFINMPANLDGPKEFDASSLAVDFFDLSSGIYAQWDPMHDSVEFIGASSVYSGYDDLVIDTTRTMIMGQYGINKVEVFIRNTSSEPLFTYQAAQPDTMQNFHDMPCALRFIPEHEVFKTSYFSFPLFMMDNSDGEVQEIFTEMLNWFLNED